MYVAFCTSYILPREELRGRTSAAGHARQAIICRQSQGSNDSHQPAHTHAYSRRTSDFTSTIGCCDWARSHTRKTCSSKSSVWGAYRTGIQTLCERCTIFDCYSYSTFHSLWSLVSPLHPSNHAQKHGAWHCRAQAAGSGRERRFLQLRFCFKTT